MAPRMPSLEYVAPVTVSTLTLCFCMTSPGSAFQARLQYSGVSPVFTSSMLAILPFAMVTRTLTGVSSL